MTLKIELDSEDMFFLYGFLKGSLDTVKKINIQAYYRIQIILDKLQPLYDKHKDDVAQ